MSEGNKKTLRQVLQSGDGISLGDVLSMANKLDIDLTSSLKSSEFGMKDRLCPAKGQVIITQFQIQFGFDEEF